jgi:hypothetical protein
MDRRACRALFFTGVAGLSLAPAAAIAQAAGQPAAQGYGGLVRQAPPGSPAEYQRGLANTVQGRLFAPPPMLPELAKETAAIMALRQINGIGLTSREIGAILPRLRELRDSEKRMRERAEQALREEKRALLAAEPGSPPPPDSGERMRQAVEEHHATERRTWDALRESIGDPKTYALRLLLGMGGGPGFDPFGQAPLGGGSGFTPAAPIAPAEPPPGGRPPRQPGTPRNPFSGDPSAPAAQPVEDPAAPALPAAPVFDIAAEGFDPAAPLAPLGGQQAAPPAQRRSADPAGRPGFGGEGYGGQRPPRQPNAGGPQGFGRQQPGFGAPQGQTLQTTLGALGFRGVRAGQNLFGGPRLTLAELIELLEQKLAAMRK